MSRDIHEKQYSDKAKTNKCNTQLAELVLLKRCTVMCFSERNQSCLCMIVMEKSEDD